MEPSPQFAVGNAQLAEVHEAAIDLFENLEYLLTVSSGRLLTLHGSGSSENGWISFSMKSPKNPAVELTLKRPILRDVLSLVIRAPMSTVAMQEVTWTDGRYKGGLDVIEGDPNDPSYESLEEALGALNALNETYAVPYHHKVVLYARLLLTSLETERAHIEPEEGEAKVTCGGTGSQLLYTGPGGEVLGMEGRGNAILEIVSNLPEGGDSAVRPVVLCGGDPALLRPIGATIQMLRGRLYFG